MRAYATSGWVVFAATILFVVGAINIIYGLIYLFNSEHVVLTPNNAWFIDLTAWGWWLLLVGVVQVLTGYGVMRAMTWARVVGVIIAAISLLSMLPILGVNSVYGLLIVTVDIIVIYALTAKGGEVEYEAA